MHFLKCLTVCPARGRGGVGGGGGGVSNLCVTCLCWYGRSVFRCKVLMLVEYGML